MEHSHKGSVRRNDCRGRGTQSQRQCQQKRLLWGTQSQCQPKRLLWGTQSPRHCPQKRLLETPLQQDSPPSSYRPAPPPCPHSNLWTQRTLPEPLPFPFQCTKWKLVFHVFKTQRRIFPFRTKRFHSAHREQSERFLLVMLIAFVSFPVISLSLPPPTLLSLSLFSCIRACVVLVCVCGACVYLCAHTHARVFV